MNPLTPDFLTESFKIILQNRGYQPDLRIVTPRQYWFELFTKLEVSPSDAFILSGLWRELIIRLRQESGWLIVGV